MILHPARVAVLITSADPDTDSFGTGFILRRQEGVVHVVTCAHVLEEVGGSERVLVSGIRPRRCVSGRPKGIDLALLEVEGLEGGEPQTLQVLEAAGSEGHPFSLVGCWEYAKGQSPVVRELRGRLGKASELPLADPQGAITIWDIHIEDGDDKLKKGCSGSPIIDQTLGSVIAIATHRLAEGEKGYALSVDALRPLLLEEGLGELPPPLCAASPPPDPLPRYLGRIRQLLTLGGVIPFLGTGVGLADGNPISLLNIALTFSEKSPILNEKPEDLISVPCSVCPLKLQQWKDLAVPDVPDNCPILQQIHRVADSTSDPNLTFCGLSQEQRLALAKVNLRLTAQLVQLVMDDDSLYEELHRIYDPEVRQSRDNVNPVYRFLATLPGRLRQLPKNLRSGRLPFDIILTTNIDEGLEDAFRDCEEPFDLLYYVASGPARGSFRYREWEGIRHGLSWESSRDPTENPDIATSDSELRLYERPLIVKLFGTWSDRFMIAEDHYVNYLDRLSTGNVLPSDLLNAIFDANNKFLLLGFSLRDPDLELIIQRLQQQRQENIPGKFYVVHQSRPGALEKSLWEMRRVRMSDDPSRNTEQCIRSSLPDYIQALDASIRELETHSHAAN